MNRPVGRLLFLVITLCLGVSFSKVWAGFFSTDQNKAKPSSGSASKSKQDSKKSPRDSSMAPSESQAAVSPAAYPPLPSFARIPRIPVIPKIPQSVTPPQVPKLPQVNMNVLEVQRQIQDMIRLNETLKGQYAGQAAEIQRIGEQARIHQQMLNQLELSKSLENFSQMTPEMVVEKEKLQLIAKTTEENRNFIEHLKNSALEKSHEPSQTESKASRADQS